MEYKYIIKGDGLMALPVHSDMNWLEFYAYFRSQVKKIYPKGNDTIWKWGVIEFINPKVMTMDDFINCGPALMGMK